VCDGTACHVKQSEPLLRAVQKRLGLTDTRNTSSDMLFTIEVVSCLGACGLAPVMVLDDEVHGQVTPERAVELVEEIIRKEQGT
jgi:NADH-quinone oxidoreductase subunit E